MNKKLLLIQVLLLTAATAGCSLAPYRHTPAVTKEASPPEKTSSLSAHKPHQADTRAVKEKIYRQHREWQGTRYSLGGLSRRGIDCSGLVHTTYRDQLGIEIPRTTRYQSQVGKAIKRSELRAGDLVFFKTSAKVRHVGIYIEDNKFFHASTKRGVTISRLSDYYWQNKYWHARRVPLNPYPTPAGK